MTPAPTTSAQAFSAAQIAAALGITDRAVRKRFGTGPWRVADLPPDYREELAKAAQRDHCRNIEHLLSSPAAPWQPAIPWNDIEESFKAKALRRQRVFRPWLENRHTIAGRMTVAEIETRGVADYAREFAEQISTRQWRYLFKRALTRDRNREEWGRPELYLDDNIRPAKVAAMLAPAPAASPVAPLAELQSLFDMIGDQVQPSPVEIESLWVRAVALFVALPDDQQRPKLKRAILEWLLAKVAGVAGSFNSARVIFDRRCKAQLAGEFIGDKRRRENRAVPVVAEVESLEIARVAAHAGRYHDGSLAPAVRDLVELGAVRSHGSADKSYVPPHIREGARRPAGIVAAFTRGGRAVKEITPHISRDPDSTHSMKILTADDCTPRVLCWWEGANGPEIGLGQLLATIDFRSWFVPMFSYQPDKNYNSHVVKALLENAFKRCALWGTLYLERGRIWRESKILKGDDMKSNEWHAAHTEAEMVYGMEKQLGVRFIHTLSPQAKSQVERMFGMVQRQMMGEPGFVGLDERADLPDSTKRQMAEVKGKKVHPSKYFYHIDQWRERLEQIFEKYNHTAQDGDYLKGLTPFQAHEKFQDRNDRPIAFDASCSFLLSDQKSRRYVNHEGVIQFEITGQRYRFWNAHTATHLANSWVLCYWNVSLPDQVCLTDLQGRNPVIVPRAVKTHLANPEDPATLAEMGRQKGVAAALRATYHKLTVPENMLYRRPVVSPAVQHISQEITEKTAALKAEQTVKDRTQRKARARGIAPATLVNDPVRADEGMELIARGLRAGDVDEGEGQGTSTKVYVLDTPATGVSMASRRAQFWGVWRKLESLKPALNRHAITFKALGYGKPVNKMTSDELNRCIEVFAAIVRDAKGDTE